MKDEIKHDYNTVKSILKGDKKAFDKLIETNKQRLFLFGMSFFKNKQDAQDFVQEVFIKAFTKLEQFHGESLFSTWISRIAYNMALNTISRRHEELSMVDESLIIDKNLQPEELQLQRATIEAVNEAVAGLPVPYALCIQMYFYYDIPYLQIANITDLPINTIKSHIFRAKQILKEKLKEIYTNE